MSQKEEPRSLWADMQEDEEDMRDKLKKKFAAHTGLGGAVTLHKVTETSNVREEYSAEPMKEKDWKSPALNEYR